MSLKTSATPTGWLRGPAPQKAFEGQIESDKREGKKCARKENLCMIAMVGCVCVQIGKPY